ncbi:MAG TPA: hypothetical protein VG963_16930, partial [Polyangiaceae bacterium]|nr:hypothetical protein [Polyangiaceae bacterium]
KTTVLPQYNRVLGEVLAEAGQYFAALTAFQPFGTAFQAQNMNCTQANLPDAVDTLCATLSDDPNDPEDQDRERLVFINQLQNAPAQVTLMRKLLGCAQDLGFKYLAIEDLEEDAAALTARGYVSRSQSGPYTREPQLARLIQDGLARGYQLVNYDVSDHCLTCTYEQDISAHAEQQATELVARTLGIDPDAKVLVLSGPRQSYKEAWGPLNQPATTSLANHVWMQSGLEPYAVDQVEIDRPAGVPFGMSALSTPSGMYMASGPDPMNARCEGAYAPRTENNRGALDAVIVHVPPQNDQSRWDWLHAPEDERRSLTLSCGSCMSGQRLLLQAFPAEVDISDRIPTDQTLCAAGDTCQVVLPAGPYQVVVWSDTERLGSAAVDLSASSSGNVSL